MAHIVAAALQTKGVIDQAKILSDMSVLNDIASFFYVFAIAMAIGSVAVFGNYRQGLYLLVGPLLYTFMVTTTTAHNGITARLGKYEVPNSVGRQTEFLKHIKAIDNEGGANVSLFYATFDGITTEVLHTLISFLLNTENKDHLRFVARERALSHVLMSIPDSGDLHSIIDRFHKECALESMQQYQTGVDSREKVIRQVRDKGDVNKPAEEAKKNWEKFKITLGPRDERMIEYISLSRVNGVYKTSCKELWHWISSELKDYAENQLKTEKWAGSKEGDEVDPKEKAMDDVKEALSTPGKGASANEVLAAYIYKNLLGQTTFGALNNHVSSSSPTNQKLFRISYEGIPEAEARGGYFGLKYFATTIPYIQGLLLYLLSIAFPFFAVLLVIPGKALSFLTWCGLWVWVKSWDLGFAMVHVARDIFWDILKHRTNTFENNVNWEDPSSIYALILNNDPLATQNTYWEIVSFMTVSVPFLTAHFCLGATGMFGMFKNSIDQTSGRFRMVETAASRRDIANSVEIARDELAGRIAETYGNMAANMGGESLSDGNGSAINRQAARTIFGDPVSQDRQENAYNISEYAKVQGATAAIALAANNFAFGMATLGTGDFQRKINDEVDSIKEFENQVNRNLPQDAPRYNLPSQFSGIAKLDEKVPDEVLNESSWYKGKLESGETPREIKWREFVQEEARLNGERLVIPHVAKVMPSMDTIVSKEQLSYIFQDPNHPLIKRMESDPESPVTIGDVFQHTERALRDAQATSAAVTGRRYMPSMSKSENFLEASDISYKIGLAARPGYYGVKGEDVPNLLKVHGMEWLGEVIMGPNIKNGASKPGITGGAGGNSDPAE